MTTTNQREPQTETLEAPPEDVAQAGIPLGTGGFGGETGSDPFTAGAPLRRFRFRSGSFVLVLVVAMSGVGLFFMRTLTRVSAAGVTRNEIETTIENFLKVLSQPGRSHDSKGLQSGGDSDRVLDVLKDDFTEKQVPLSDVHRNPFIIYQLAGPAGGSGSTSDDQSETRRASDQRRAKRLDDVEKAVARLRLKSVILGSEPLANLNGQIVRVGDFIKLDDDSLKLRVTGIDKDSILVRAEEPELELSVEKTLYLRPPN